jgi:hypothetical protein
LVTTLSLASLPSKHHFYTSEHKHFKKPGEQCAEEKEKIIDVSPRAILIGECFPAFFQDLKEQCSEKIRNEKPDGKNKKDAQQF